VPSSDPTSPNECVLNFPDLDWIPTDGDRLDIRAEIPGAEASRAAIWQFGFDISKGRVIDSLADTLTKEMSSFSVVRRGFKLEEGQKVGMAIVFSHRSKPTKKTVAGSGEDSKRITEADLLKIYGQPDAVNIYTGEIKKVWGGGVH
jgi:hypothetical protein